MVEGQNKEDEENFIKVVVVGEGAVGKTCMVMTYGNDEFPPSYVTTVMDSYESVTRFQGKEVKLQIWDTAGQQDFQRLRPLSYTEAHCFIICFSLVDKNSLAQAVGRWRQEVTELGPRCPHILVGTKLDLREHYMSDPAKKDICVTEDEGKAACEKYAFYSYVECSAKKQKNLNKVFYMAQEAVFNHRQTMKDLTLRKGAGGQPDESQVKQEKKGICSLL